MVEERMLATEAVRPMKRAEEVPVRLSSRDPVAQASTTTMKTGKRVVEMKTMLVPSLPLLLS